MTTMKKFRTITARKGSKNDEKNLQQYYHRKGTCASYELLASSQRSTQQFRSFCGTCVSCHASPAGEYCCHPSLFAGIRFHDSKTLSKNENTWITDRSSKKQCFSNFSGFFFAQTLWWGTTLLFLQLLEHHAVWLEHLFQSSNILYACVHLTARVMYFYSRGETAN